MLSDSIHAHARTHTLSYVPHTAWKKLAAKHNVQLGKGTRSKKADIIRDCIQQGVKVWAVRCDTRRLLTHFVSRSRSAQKPKSVPVRKRGGEVRRKNGGKKNGKRTHREVQFVHTR